MAQSHKTWTVFLRTQSARFSDPSPVILRNYLAQWSANLPPECLQRKKKDDLGTVHLTVYIFPLKDLALIILFFLLQSCKSECQDRPALCCKDPAFFQGVLSCGNLPISFCCRLLEVTLSWGEKKIKSRKWSVYPFVARYFIFICKNLHKPTELFLF